MTTTSNKQAILSMEKEEIFHKLLKKECGYYRAILELTRNENDKFKRNRPIAELTHIMKKKKILLNCIAEIESALRPLKKHWDQHKDDSNPHAQEVQEQLSALQGIVKEILGLDQENQLMITGYLKTLKAQK